MESLSGAILKGGLQALLTNVTLSCKGLLSTNASAYSTSSSATKKAFSTFTGVDVIKLFTGVSYEFS